MTGNTHHRYSFGGFRYGVENPDPRVTRGKAYLFPLSFTCSHSCSPASAPADHLPVLIPAHSCSIALLHLLWLNCAHQHPSKFDCAHHTHLCLVVLLSSLGHAHLLVRAHLWLFTHENRCWRPFAPVRAHWQFRPLSILPAVARVSI